MEDRKEIELSVDGDKCGNTRCDKSYFEIIIFDSIGVNFHFQIFAKQLLAQLFPPLFFFIGSRSQFPNKSTAVYTLIHPFIVFIMVLSYFLSPNVNKFGGAVWIPLIYFLLHRCIVAVKYASLSETEYLRFRNCDDLKVSTIYLMQMQLFSSWLNFDKNVLLFEIGAAAARVGARINKIYFLIENPEKSPTTKKHFLMWNAFMLNEKTINKDDCTAKELQKQPDGDYHVSVYDFIYCLLQRVNVYSLEDAQKSIQIFTWINLLIPIVSFLLYSYNKIEGWTVIFFLTSTYINFLYSALYYQLLYIAIVDVQRTFRIFSLLECMLRLSDISLCYEREEQQDLMNSRINPEVYRAAEARTLEIFSMNEWESRCVRNLKSNYTDLYKNVMLSNTAVPIISKDLATESNPFHFSPNSDKSMRALNQEEKPRNSILGEHVLEVGSSAMMPRLIMIHPQNPIAWCYARLTLQNFGDRFRFRTDIYVAISLFWMFLTMVLTFLALTAAHANFTNILQTPLIFQCLLTVVMSIVFLVILSAKAATVNDMLEMHCRTLASHALNIREKIWQKRNDPEHDAECISRFQEASENLDTAREISENATERKPFSIFGMKAQSAITYSILSSAFTFFCVLISFFINPTVEEDNLTV